jgi:hypothetical protein
VVEFQNSEQFLKYKQDLIASGSEFAEPINVSGTQTGNVSDSVTARSGNLIFDAWVGDINGNKDVYGAISFDNARSFNSPFLLSVNSTGDSLNPTVAIVNSSFHAAWENHVNGVSNIMKSTSMDGGISFITYQQTNATSSGAINSISDAFEPVLIPPAVTVQQDNNNMTLVTNVGDPYLKWLQTTITVNGPITEEHGHGRTW